MMFTIEVLSLLVSIYLFVKLVKGLCANNSLHNYKNIIHCLGMFASIGLIYFFLIMIFVPFIDLKSDVLFISKQRLVQDFELIFENLTVVFSLFMHSLASFVLIMYWIHMNSKRNQIAKFLVIFCFSLLIGCSARETDTKNIEKNKDKKYIFNKFENVSDYKNENTPRGYKVQSVLIISSFSKNK